MKKLMLLASLLLASVVAQGDDANKRIAEITDAKAKGLAVAKEMKARNTGWGDSEAKMTMILRDKGGNETDRKVRVKSLEVEGDGDKGLSIFDEPRDVEGTAFLTYSHIEGNDDQWLYLPALKRVKRISSSNKSGPWMGSEFAYEDMGSFEPEKYEFTYLRDEPCGENMTCFVVESDPVDKFSGYTRQINWIDTEHYRAIKTEFYDRKNTLLKTLELSEWKLYKDTFWRAHQLDMQNHQNGKSTTRITHSMEFDTGLSESDFSQASLKRAR